MKTGLSVSRRFVIMAAAGVPLVAAAWFAGLSVYVFIFYNLLAVGLLALDYYLSPKPQVLTAERAPNDKLFFQAENTIAFTVYNASGHVLRVQATDEINDRHFTVTGENMRHLIAPGGEAVFSYSVRPAKRGAFMFHRLHLRYTGLLGLCVKYASIDCPFDFKVYPNLMELGKYRLMTQKNRLLPRGEKTVRLYGAGMEFESLRTYVEGDDYRKINWMATARESKLMLNQYQTEKNQPVFILLDTGRPMSYAVGGYKKLDYAINASLILSDIVNHQGDNSGLMVFDSAVHAQIMPGKGATHRNQMMETLYHVTDTRQTADYEGAFRMLCDRWKRRALVFIFTDFEIWEEAESLIAHIALLRKRHMPIVVFMKNESLLELASGPVYGRKDAVLRDTAAEFLTERRQIYRKLNAMRIPNIESAADTFAVAAVNKYLAFRQRSV